MDVNIELYHDNFQNFKRYNIPKAQLVIADIPYNIGADAYASNPMWYQDGDNKNGESTLAKSSFFHTDGTFKIAEYMHFCNRLLRKEPKEKGQAPAMIVFCAFEQMRNRYGTDVFNTSVPFKKHLFSIFLCDFVGMEQMVQMSVYFI